MTTSLPRRILMAVTLPIIILAGWWIVSADSTDPFWPPLKDIFTALGRTWFEGRMTSDVIPSLLRLAAGYTSLWWPASDSVSSLALPRRFASTSSRFWSS